MTWFYALFIQTLLQGLDSISQITITVGKSKVTDKNTGLQRPCKYSDVPTDYFKWVYDLTYMPIPYDLMHLKFKASERVKSGWWNGFRWRGLRVKRSDKVIAWKRQEYD